MIMKDPCPLVKGHYLCHLDPNKRRSALHSDLSRTAPAPAYHVRRSHSSSLDLSLEPPTATAQDFPACPPLRLPPSFPDLRPHRWPLPHPPPPTASPSPARGPTAGPSP